MNTFINDSLNALADNDYKAFNKKIIPTNYEVLGVRMPALKKLAKGLSKRSDIEAYFDNAEFNTYEHILLYGLILAQKKDFTLEKTFHYLDPLILRFDNWAHVDTLVSAFQIFKKHPDAVLGHFLPLKDHDGEYTKRFFVILLMCYFMNDNHIEKSLDLMVNIQQGQYYVDMGIAWAISLGLVKSYDKTIDVLEQKRFSKFVHNKAIQKARESYRISPEIKESLNKLKIK